MPATPTDSPAAIAAYQADALCDVADRIFPLFPLEGNLLRNVAASLTAPARPAG